MEEYVPRGKSKYFPTRGFSTVGIHKIGQSVLSVTFGVAFALTMTQQAMAQDNWAGAGADALWADTLNWTGGVPPVNGTTVVFGTTVKLLNTNNINNLLLNGIIFNGTGFTLYQAAAANAITNENGVLDTVGGNSINIIQTLTGPETFTNIGTGTTTFASSITNNGWNITVAGSGNVTLNGVLGGTNTASTNAFSGGLTYTGTATLRLAAANTFTGGVTNMGGGILQLGNNAAIPTGAGKGDLHLVASTLDLDAFSPTFNGLYGDGASTINNSAGAGTYTITVGNTASSSAGVFNGAISPSSGIVALTKINTNTFTLNGFANHTGPTTISAGTFIVGANGGLNGSTNIIIAPGALLDVSALPSGLNLAYGGLVAGRATNPAAGIFDINGSVVNNSGPMVVYSAGLAGTESINGSLNLNGIVQFDLGSSTNVGGGSNDLIIMNGTLTLGTATIVLNPASGSFLSGGTYTLVSNISGTAVSGTVAGLTAATPRGATATFKVDAHNNLTVTISGTGAAGNLVWAGTASLSTWDVQTTQDWYDGGTTNLDYFFNLDNVTFNDAGYNTVTIATGVSPDSTTVTNTLQAYTFLGTGLISGSGGFTKNGTNIVIFETPNTYTGDTVLNGGALVLGTQTAAPVLNVDVYAGVTPGNLWLNGAGLYMNDAANNTYQANFNNVEIGPGANAFNTRSRQSSSLMQAQIQQIVRNGVGGTFDLNVGQKASGPQVGTMVSNTTTVNAILGGWATFANADWLVPTNVGEGSLNLGNTADGAGSMGTYQTTTTPSAWGAASNVFLSASPTAPVAASMTINSLKILGASLTNSSGVTLTLSSGGLLMPITTGNAASIVGGTLMGATNTDLVVHQWNVGSTLTIGSVIADNTNGSATMGSALTKTGQGTLILTNANTYTGPTFINGPTLNGQPNAATPTWFPAGSLQLGNGGTAGSISNSLFITNSGTLIFNRTDTSGYGGVISGLGGVKQIGIGGTAVLGNDETYFGATTISAGTLQVGAGGSAGSISNSASVADTGTLVFNSTGTRTYPGTITGGGGVVNAGAGTIILNGTNTYTGSTIITAGTLALGATGSISNSPLVSNVLGSTLDVSALAGGLVLSSSGAGQTLAISGSVNGNITAGGGTTISPGGAGGAGTAAFKNNLTLNGGTLSFDVNGASWDQITVGGTLNLSSGAISLNNFGPNIPNGTYPLVTAASITGNAGNLNAPVLIQGGQIDFLTNNGTVLSLVVASGSGANLTWAGTGSIWDVTNTVDWLNGATPSVFHNEDYVTFNTTGDPDSTVNINAVVSPAAVTVNDPSQPYTFQGAGKITLGASLTMANADTLTVLTTNDYQGYTAILNGTVNVGNGSASGSLGRGALTNNAALVYNIPDNQAIAGAISGTGTLSLIGQGEVSLTGNNASYSGSITINGGILEVGANFAGGGTTGTLGTGPVVNNTLLAFNRTGAPLTYGGSISGGGVVSNSGLGTVILSGSNGYSGNTIIAQGTIKVGSTTAIPNGIGSGNVELDGVALGSTGTLDLNGFDTAINGLLGAAGTVPGTVANSGAGTHTLIIGTGGNSTTYSGQIVDNTGSGGKVALLVEGGVTQTIDIESAIGNTFSGGTVISNATVQLTSPNQPYPGAGAVALGSGPITLYGGTLNVVGSTGSTSPTWSPGLANTVIVPTGQTATIGGCQRGPFSPILQGSGTLVYIANYVRGALSGNWSAFTGQVILQAAATSDQLAFAGATGGYNKIYVMNTLILYNTTTGNPTVSIGELADDGTTQLTANSVNTSGQAAIYSVGGANTSTNFGGSIVDGNSIQKVGTGTWTLTGATLTYTGSTTVSNGVLAFATVVPTTSSTWTIAAPGILDVSGPGTLTIGATADQTILGNGTIRGNLTAGPDAVVQVGGASIGTLTVTNAASLAGNITMKLNSTNAVQTNDVLAANSIVLGGTLTVNNTGPTLVAGQSFKLFSSTNITGSFTAVSLPANNGAGVTYTWNTNQLATNGIISVLSGGGLVNTNSTNFTYSVSSGVLTLGWPSDHTGWFLQMDTNSIGLTTNEADWVTVTNSSATNSIALPIATNVTATFFRLYYP